MHLFVPVHSKEEESLVLPEGSSLDTLRSRISESVTISETYGKLAEFGLKFGPTFQTLKAMWKTPENEVQESLFEVEVTSPPSKYVVHPVIADALFQALMFSAGPSLASKLHVPVSVEKYIVFGALDDTSLKCFIHCTPSPTSTNEV
jgi:myxalamid-type polyketide synthase MxaD